MKKITINNLFTGISQQNEEDRLVSHCNNQKNIINDVVKGSLKRYPTKYINTLDLKENTYSNIIDINEKKYILIINNDENNPVSIYDLDGNSISIKYDTEEVKDYFLNYNLRENGKLKEIFKSLTIKNETIVINKDFKVESIKNANDEQKETITEIQPYSYRIEFDNIYDENCSGANSEICHRRRLTIRLDSNIFSTRTKLTLQLMKRIVGFINNKGIYEAKFVNNKTMIVSKKNGDKMRVSGTIYFDSFDSRYNYDANIIEFGGEQIIDSKKFYNFVEIKKAVENTKYSIIVDNGIKYTTTIDTNDTNLAATQIANNLSNISDIYRGISLNNYILIYTINDDFEFNIYTTAESGNENIKTIGHIIGNSEILPAEGFFSNYVIKVENDINNDFDNYYTIFKNGSWIEWKSTNIENDIYSYTLPKKIIYDEETESFIISNLELLPRLVGDNSNAPMPSFVENKIKDIIIFKNRLCIITNDTLSFSSSENYENFFPKTVKNILQTEPIDIKISSNKKVDIKYVTNYNNKLIIFGKDKQYILSGNDNNISINNISITPSMEYNINEYIYPVVLGNKMYFSINNGEYLKIIEMEGNKLNDITSHVPNFLHNKLDKLVGDKNKNMLFLVNEKIENDIYVYNGFEKQGIIQEAWTKFEFKKYDSINNIEIIDEKLYIFNNQNIKIIRNTDSDTSDIISEINENRLYLQYMNLEEKKEENKNYEIMIDDKIDCLLYENSTTVIMNEDNNIYGLPKDKIFTLFKMNNTNMFEFYIYGHNDFYIDENNNVLKTKIDNSVVILDNEYILKNREIYYYYGNIENDYNLSIFFVEGDYTNYNNLKIGELYDCEYELSKINHKYNGIVNNNYKIKLKKIEVNYKDSGEFNIEVKPKKRNNKIKTINKKIKINDYMYKENINTNIGNSLVISDNDSVKIKLSNNGYLPFNFNYFNIIYNETK